MIDAFFRLLMPPRRYVSKKDEPEPPVRYSNEPAFIPDKGPIILPWPEGRCEDD